MRKDEDNIEYGEDQWECYTTCFVHKVCLSFVEMQRTKLECLDERETSG